MYIVVPDAIFHFHVHELEHFDEVLLSLKTVETAFGGGGIELTSPKSLSFDGSFQRIDSVYILIFPGLCFILILSKRYICVLL